MRVCYCTKGQKRNVTFVSMLPRGQALHPLVFTKLTSWKGKGGGRKATTHTAKEGRA